MEDYRVGALTITSPATVSQIVDNLGNNVKYVIEYGAGDGIVTGEILQRIPSDGKVVAVELNKNFLPDLESINDSRLTVLYDDVVSVSAKLSQLGLPRIDAVVSGIPFSFFNSDNRERIVASTYRALCPGGHFIVYQYSTFLKSLLEKYFTKVQVRYAFKNIPPYFIMVAKKSDNTKMNYDNHISTDYYLTP